MVTKLLSGHPDLLHSFNYFLLHNLIPPIGSQKNAVYTVVHARHGRPKRSYQDYRTDLEDTREWRTNRRRKISDVISKPAGRLSFLSTKSSRLDHTKEHPGWQQNGIPLRVPDMVARLNQERMMPQNDRERRSPDCGIIPDITLTSSCWESSSSGIVTFSEPEVLDTEPRHILVFESELEWSTDSPTRPPTPVLIEAPSERSMDQNGGDEPVYSIVINSFPTSTWDARPEDSRSHEDLEFYDMEFRLSSMLELEAAFERNAPSSPGPT
ncbi:hypothetical protein EV426DRAFT_57269 [Tirmania nivea]|nr:hypothetical protein EV426DRAFT_57269 [Tirmania nivea]